jgi:catechol 2,3-dioxygenase-like lactoylglutathione lyase family enzyme
VAVIKVNTVNHVGVPVKDRKQAFAFYRDLLGLKVIPSMVDNENIAWLQAADGTMVHIVEPTSVRMAAPHTAYEVDDFDQALKAVQEAGLKVDGPGERHGGQRYFFVLDPDGNRVEFVTAGGNKPVNRVADEWGYTRPA